MPTDNRILSIDARKRMSKDPFLETTAVGSSASLGLITEAEDPTL